MIRINSFFERVVYLSGNEERWRKFHQQCSKRNIIIDKVDLLDPSKLLVPRGALFNANELSEVQTIYNVLNRANIDRIQNLLIFSGNVIFCDNYEENFHSGIDFLNMGLEAWDLIYFGCSESSLHQPNYNKQMKLHKAFGAKGICALGINNSFYPLFLESARVPSYPIDMQISSSLSLVCNVFVAIPPLFKIDGRFK